MTDIAPEVAVSVRGVDKSFGQSPNQVVHALAQVDLQVTDGEVIALLGPSGCGKSTLLRLVAGLITPTSGEVLVYGNRVVEPHPIMGMMFQRPVLFPWFTVLENIVLPVRVDRGDMKDARQRAQGLIQLVGLEDFGNHYPWQLSGGMQQRVAICRMLINRPRLLLLDEPFAALDELTREFMDSELRRILDTEAASAILVTHNPLEAAFVADRVVVMTSRPGRIAGEVYVELSGPRSRELFASAELLEAVKGIRDLFEPSGDGR